MNLDGLEDAKEMDSAYILNDITLTTIIIVLFFALIFATLATTTKVLQHSNNELPESTPSQKPTQNTGTNHYGKEGFPEVLADKGFPEKETFNQELLITENQAIRPGVIGNKVWSFEEIDDIKDRQQVLIKVDRIGNLSYKENIVELEWMKEEISRLAETQHVFIKVIIAREASVKVYEIIRNHLWNESNAIHWNFVTE